MLRRHERVVAFGAHPDDLEVGAGGLLSRLVAEGAQVTMAVVSVPQRFAERVAEARAGARVIGADVMLLFEDRECRVEDIPMHELVRRFDWLIGDRKPDLVITHAAHDLHFDHSLVHRATLSALRRTPCDVLAFMSSPELNATPRTLGQCFANISDTIEAKLAAIACHETQLPRLDLEATRDLARGTGRIGGYQYAEAYEVLRLRM